MESMSIPPAPRTFAQRRDIVSGSIVLNQGVVLEIIPLRRFACIKGLTSGFGWAEGIVARKGDSPLTMLTPLLKRGK